MEETVEKETPKVDKQKKVIIALQITIAALTVVWIILIPSLHRFLFNLVLFGFPDAGSSYHLSFWLTLFFPLFVALPSMAFVVYNFIMSIKLLKGKNDLIEEFGKNFTAKFIIVVVVLPCIIITTFLWHLVNNIFTLAGIIVVFAPLGAILALACILFVLEIRLVSKNKKLREDEKYVESKENRN